MRQTMQASIMIFWIIATSACGLDRPDQQEHATPNTSTTSSAITSGAGSGGCLSGQVCVYQFANENANNPDGGFIKLDGDGLVAIPSFHQFSFNDELTSWCNFSSQQYCYWFDNNYSGTKVIMGTGTCHDQVLPANDNQASSIAPCV